MGKEVVKHFRMTTEQALVLAKQAEEANMTVSEYFRLLITQTPNDYPEIRDKLNRLINEVNRIGVNVNQIVHNNNSSLYREEDKVRLIAYMRKLNTILDKAVVDIGNHKDSSHEEQ